MNKKFAIFAVLLAAIVLAGCSVATQATQAAASDADDRSMTEYTTFSPATEAELKLAVDEGWASSTNVIVKTDAGFDASAFARAGATVLGSFDLEGSSYYHLAKSGGTVKLLAKLRSLPGVIYAEHELISKVPEGGTAEDLSTIEKGLDVGSRDASSIKTVLDDPMAWTFSQYELTGAIEAYRYYGFGPNTVYVADIDTGLNLPHEDFTNRNGTSIVAYAKSAFASDDGGQSFTYVGDGTGFVTVPAGENWDDNGHGSHTAGIIAACGNNGKGVAGVCWDNVKLISYKCFSEDPAAADYSGGDWAVYGGLADLIAWKKANNITQTIPVNMSLGSMYAGFFDEDMISQAFENGIVIIASSGNSGFNAAHYPSAYAGVIAVGATKSSGEKVSFSVGGDFLSVMAPGYNIDSTYTGGTAAYANESGTSMSCPFVTGLVAYLLTYNPTLKADQIKTILERTATDMGSYGWDADTGYGLVNVKAAIEMVRSGRVPASGSVYSAKTTRIYVQNTNANFDSGISGKASAVVNQAVYLYDSRGKYVTVGLTNGRDGSAAFNLLKPGNYTVKTNYCGQVASKQIKVSSTSATTCTLSFDVAILFIQTLYNHYADPTESSSADSIITLYDASGNTVAGPMDSGYLDTLSVAGLTSGGTYYVAIDAYNDRFGEYGLNVGFTGKASVDTDNGRGSLDSDDSFEDNDAPETAATIVVGTDYGLYLGDPDWFTFVMP